MPRLGFDWHTRARPIGSEELASSIAPIMSYCIEQFGPNRWLRAVLWRQGYGRDELVSGLSDGDEHSQE
jgi:hypothetical protein